MQKLFKRSLAMVLALMMVITMFAGAMADTQEAYTKYDGTNTAMFHIASEGAADLSAPNALDMQYLAQEFVPATSTISGAKLNINLTSGSVVMHVELRKGDVLAEPFFGTDVTLNSVGDSQTSFYTLDFGENVEVTPGEVYYLAFWMKSKSSDGIVVIAQGGVSEGHPVYRHKRFDADGTMFTPDTAPFKATENAMGFEILPGVTEAPDQVIFFDGDALPHHAAQRGKWETTTQSYTKGNGAYRVLADYRSGDKLSESRLYNDNLLDITGLYNENGEFYFTFDMYVDPEYMGKADHYDNDNNLVETKNFGLENTRMHVMLYSKGEVNANATEPRGSKQAIEITRWERGNANANETNDWSMFGLENGLQPGWNHMAIKLTDKDGVLSYAKAGNEASWDPTKMWGMSLSMRCANWQDPFDQHGTVDIFFDDIKFMSVDAYEANFATDNKVKDVISKIAAIQDADDEANIKAAAAALAALSEEEKALVTNRQKLDDIYKVVDKSIYALEGKNVGSGYILIPGGPHDNKPYPTTPTPWTETFTEGISAGKVQWADTSAKTMHMSILGIDQYWDFSDVEYITFDLYVHGWKVTNAGDSNFGFGAPNDAGSWGAQGYGWVGKDKVLAWAKNLKEGWNHIVIEIPAGARKETVGNMRLYFENSLEFTVAVGDKAYAIVDDIRAVNKNALPIVEERNAAKDVFTGIQLMKTVEDVKALRVAYDALNDTQKAYVTNIAVLEEVEANIFAGEAIDAAFVALTDKTFAGKDAVYALYDQYDALNDEAKAYATCADELVALKADLDAKQVALDDANAKIAAIPAIDELDLMDKFVIDAANNAYEALAEDVKPFVVGADTIALAYAKVDELYAAATPEDLAAFVDQTIMELPSADVVTLNDAELVNNVAITYEELGEAKALVSKEAVAKLYALRVVVAALKADAEAAAAVDAAIAALNAELTLADKDAVYAARDAYADLNDNAKAQVTLVATLDDAVAAMDKLVADDAAAAALTEAINALSKDDKQAIEAVIAQYEAANAETIALLAKETVAKYVAAKAALANMEAYEIQFRGFDNQKADYNINWNSEGKGQVFVGNTKPNNDFNVPAVGYGYMGGKATGSSSELHHFIYAYNQNHDDAADGSNADGQVKFLVENSKELYVSFDFYVSDASIINNATGDCGFGIDAESADPDVNIGTFQGWGTTFITRATEIKPLLKDVKDGWNHIVLPLSLVKPSAAELINGTEITLRTMRFYICGVDVTAGFVSAVDDVRFMNKEAADKIFPARTKAKVVTDMIRAYPAEATVDDFYAVQLAYEAVADEYKDLVIGWDAFVEAKQPETPTDAQLAEDKAAAAPVIEAIAALDKDITVDDKDAIEKAEVAFADLTDNQKVLVGNDYILTWARAAYDEAKKIADDKAAAAAVDALIAELPETVSDTDVTNTDIAAARKAYDDLTDAQKGYVTGLAKLEAAEANLAIVIDITAAAEVEAMVNALPTPTDITDETVSTTDVVAKVNAAVEAYGKLTPAQKALLSAGIAEKLAACVEAIANPALSYKMGDIDKSGKVDAKDALLVLKAAVDKVELNAAQEKAADVNEDGKLDAKDALEMLKFAVGKPSKLDKFYAEA